MTLLIAASSSGWSPRWLKEAFMWSHPDTRYSRIVQHCFNHVWLYIRSLFLPRRSRMPAPPFLLYVVQILFYWNVYWCSHLLSELVSLRTCLSSDGQVIHVTGRIRCRPALVPGSTRSVRRPMGLVALAHTLPPSTLNEVRMESHMFVFRVNMDLQVIYCENR